MQSLETLVAVHTPPTYLQNGEKVQNKLLNVKKGIKCALLNMQYKIYARDG